MNLLMTALLILPMYSYCTTHWLPDKYLLKYRWLATIGLVVSGLIGIGLLIVIHLINSPEFVQTSALPWYKIGGYILSISLTINPLSGLVLAMWSTGSLLFSILITTAYFDKTTFRENLLNLSIGTLAANGFILTNDLLTLLFFWALTDLAAYRILSGSKYSISSKRTSNTLTILGNLGLLLAVTALFKSNASLRLDAISAQIIAGDIPPDQLLLPGIMIGLVSLSRIFQAWDISRNSEGAHLRPSDELIQFSGLIPAGLLLIIKLLPVLTPSSPALLFFGGGGAVIISGILMAQPDLKHFIHLNTVLQLCLSLIAIGIGAVTLSTYILIELSILNPLLIILTRDLQNLRESYPENFYHDSALPLPIRILLLSGLIGFPLTLTFNVRLLLLNLISIFSSAGTAGRTILLILIGLIFFQSTVAIFRLFLISGVLRPVLRKSEPLPAILLWTSTGLAVLGLFPFFTLPQLNPLNLSLNGMSLLEHYPGTIPLPKFQTINQPLLITYFSLLLIGLLTGFILSKYQLFDAVISRFTAFQTNLIARGNLFINNTVQTILRKIVRFDTQALPKLGSMMTSLSLNYPGRHPKVTSNQATQLETSSVTLLSKILIFLRRVNLPALILLALLILIIILLCII